MLQNVLLVGSGSIGMRHAASIKSICPDAKISFLREFGRADQSPHLSEEYGMFSSLDAALSQPPDLMVIANPSSMHFRYIEAAILHGVPFYIEKPLVTSAVEFAQLRQLVEACPKMPINMVGCNLRFLPSLCRLHEMLQAKRIGNVVRASFEAGQWLPDWRPTQDYSNSYSAKSLLGGGVLLDLIHEIDAANWLLGKFDTVQGALGKFSNLSIETEDVAALILSRPQGPLVTIQLDYVSRIPVRKYSFVGDLGSIEWDLRRKTLTLSEADGRVELLDLPESDFSVVDSYLTAMREMLAAIAGNRPTSQTIEEGLAALDVVFTVRKN